MSACQLWRKLFLPTPIPLISVLLYYLVYSALAVRVCRVLATVRSVFDKVGITVTSLCAIHCIMLPVILPLLPLLGYHRKLYPFYSLFLGGFIYWQKDVWGHEYEHAVLMVGATLVVLAHIMNMRLCNSCNSCEDDH